MGMTLPPHEVFLLVFVTSCLHAIYTKKTMEKIHPQQTGTTFMPQTTIETPIQPGTAQLRQPWKRLSVMAATLSLLPGRFPDVKMELWSSGCKLEAEIMKCWCQVCNPKWHPQSLFFKGQLAKPSTDIISDVYYKLDYILFIELYNILCAFNEWYSKANTYIKCSDIFKV